LKKSKRLIAEVNGLEVGDEIFFKNMSEYLAIEFARISSKSKKFSYVIKLEEPQSFSLKRIS